MLQRPLTVSSHARPPPPAVPCVTPLVHTQAVLAHLRRTRRSLWTAQCGSTDSVPPLPSGGEIASTSNTYVKHCVKLRTTRAHREACGRTLVVGAVPVAELIEESTATAHQSRTAPQPVVVETLFLAHDADAPAGLPDGTVVRVSPAVLAKLAGVQSAAGIGAAAVVRLPQPADLNQPSTISRLLVLEGIQDPGNLGTSLRTACALGWDAAYLLPGCCDCFNDKALRAGRGAAFRLPLAGGTWRDLQRVLKANNLVPVAAHPHPKDSGADAFGELRQLDGVALVLGSEGQGLSDATLASCRRVSIPMHRMESLNVAVAGSILMWALRPADGKPV